MDNETFVKQWKEFEDGIRNCQMCSLCQNRTNVVIYRGARKAPLMIIGEAPGAEEDEKGLPFVGKSGKLLQNLLNSLDFKIDDYHICNICRCRPPENKRPESSEIAACKKHLAKEFMLVRPKVILLMGSTAYEAFFGQKPLMKDVRGVFIEKNGYLIMTTYHPAYALRNPQGKIPIYEDVLKVRNKLSEMGILNPMERINE